MTKRTKEEGLKFDGTGLGGEVTRLLQVIDEKYCRPNSSDNAYEKGPDTLIFAKACIKLALMSQDLAHTMQGNKTPARQTNHLCLSRWC